MSCPSSQQLATLAEGSPDAAALAHLEGCAACRDVLQLVRTAGSDDLIGGGADEASAPAPGDTIGRYVVLRAVAQGGMGEVYLGYDPILDRNLALKLVRADRSRSPAFAARLAHEAQVLAKLAHGNVVRVFDAGVWRGVGYVAMEYLDGESVRTWCATDKRSAADIIRVFSGAARGIGAAHALGIVHRDVKPDNILVGTDGGGRIADFGLVSVGADTSVVSADDGERVAPVGHVLTDGRTAVGTPGYRAPELIAGGVADARSDQWSLCAALWEMLAGVRPASADAITSAPGISSGVVRALRRGLDADPARRFATMDDLAAALEQRPRGARYVAAGALLVAAAATAAMWVARDRDPLAHCEREGANTIAVADGLRGPMFEHRFGIFGAGADARRAATKRELHSYTTRLAASAVGACRVEPRDRAAATLQRECVADRRRELAALVTALATTDRGGLEQAPLAIAKLTDPALCDDPARLATIVPIDAATRAQAEQLAGELAIARSRWLLGDRASQLTIARQLAERGERLGATAATATSGFLADILGESGDLKGAADAHMIAARHAARAHDDRALAQHLVRAGGVAAVDLAFERSSTLLASAELVVQRAGDPSLQHALDAAKAELAIQRRDAAQAVTLSRALVASLGDRRGPEYFAAMFLLARALSATSELTQARDVARTALAEITASFGADHPATAPFETHLGRIASEQNDLAGAKTHLERALHVARTAYGDDNVLTSDAINNVATIMLLQGGDDERAIELAKRGIAIGERLGSRRLHGMMLSLGTVYLDTGNVKDGLPLLQRVLAMREEIYGPESSELLRPLIILGMASADAKDLDSARRYWGRGVAILDRMPAPPDFGVDLMRDYAKIIEDPRARRLMLTDADALERRLGARAKLASKR